MHHLEAACETIYGVTSHQYQDVISFLVRVPIGAGPETGTNLHQFNVSTKQNPQRPVELP